MNFLSRVFILSLFIGCSDKNNDEVLPLIIGNDQEIIEGNSDSYLTIELQLSKKVDFDLSFRAVTSTSSALEYDFDKIDTLIVVKAGTISIPINIRIVGDKLPEEDEIFYLNLTDPINVEFENESLIIKILNDDTHEFTIPETGYKSSDSYEGMQMIWSDEFDGSEINLGNWTYENGDGCPNICGWGNNELEYYRPQNAHLDNGFLVIEANNESYQGKQYTSTKLISQGKLSFKYGRIDARAALPAGKGLWPAIWMLGNSISSVGWPACGEIDIIEMIGGSETDKIAYGTAHWDNNGSNANYGGNTKSEMRLADEFHVYSIEWNEQSITWYFDDEPFHVIDITPSSLSEFHKEFYFILNVAVGGNWPGSPDQTTVFPQWMIVDYIRVFQ